MDRDRWMKVKEIMLSLDDVPQLMREQWLIDACEGDQSLFNEVMSLLDIDGSSTSQLEQPFHSAHNKPVLNDLKGRKMGPWVLDRELGVGGMGSVWLARRADRQFQMLAAVKLVKTQHISKKELDLFLQERQIMANLKHPNIAMLLDGGATEDQRPYLVMEYVEGQTIDVWLTTAKPSRGEALAMFRQICLSLTYAHRKGVLHRDIKCGNIMVTHEGIPKILDFGIASRHGVEEVRPSLMLTPEFAPPESLEGGPATVSGDLYSLGLVLFQMLTGKRPRDLEVPAAEAVREADTISGELSDILLALLAENPVERYQSADDLLMDIERLLGGLRVRQSSHSKARYDAVFWHDPEDAASVETIARRLEDECHLKIWLPTWHLGPGELAEEALRRAISESHCCIAPIGPSGKAPWKNAFQRGELEAMHALKPRRMIPLLLPGALQPDQESDLPKFLRRRTWATLSEELEKGELNSLAKAIQGRPSGREERPFQAICPFRGLDFFREKDGSFFFGRETMLKRLRSHMKAHRFLAILGYSGSGKSSVLQAGLIPILRRQENGVLLMQPGSDPLDELASQFEALFGEPDPTHAVRLRDHPSALFEIARNWCDISHASRLCIVVDQFEEIFTLAEEPKADFFLAQLLYALEQPNPKVAVVLAMRSDFLEHCAQYPDLKDYLLENSVHMRPMTRDALVRSIEEPAREVGLTFEKDLIERMLDDLDNASSALPLLQHTLLELYNRRDGQRLTHEAYNAIGGIEGALTRRAEAEYLQLSPQDQSIFRKILTLGLIQPGSELEDSSRRTTLEDITQTTGSPEQTRILLHRLTRLRLLTGQRDDTNGIEYIEVSHEALIKKWPRVQEWMGEDRETILLLDRLRGAARIWKKSENHPDLLLRGEPLQQTLIMVERKDIYPGDLERDYLHDSNQIAKKNRRMRRRSHIFTLAVAFIISLSLWQFKLHRDNRRQDRKLSDFSTLSIFITDLFQKLKMEESHGLTPTDLSGRGLALLDARFPNQPEYRSMAMSALAGIHQIRNEPDHAFHLLVVARSELDKGEHWQPMAVLLNQMAELEISRDNQNHGFELAGDALRLVEQRHLEDPSRAWALLNMGIAQLHFNRLNEADLLLGEAADIFRAPQYHHHPRRLPTLRALAKLKLKKDRPDQALPLLLEILDTEGLSPESNLEHAQDLKHLAEAQAYEKQFRLAERNAEKAQALLAMEVSDDHYLRLEIAALEGYIMVGQGMEEQGFAQMEQSWRRISGNNQAPRSYEEKALEFLNRASRLIQDRDQLDFWESQR